MVLEFHKKNFRKFEGYFFKELELMEIEYCRKLEYSKSGRFLYIFEIMIN